MYTKLDQIIRQNNLNPCVVIKVGHHVMSQKDNKFCIFHYRKGAITDIKYYNNLQVPTNIMMRFLTFKYK